MNTIRPFPEEGSCEDLKEWYFERRKIFICFHNRMKDRSTGWKDEKMSDHLHELCTAILLIPGIVISQIDPGDTTASSLKIWLYSYNQIQMFPLTRSIDRRYGGSYQWRLQVECGDMEEYANSLCLSSGGEPGLSNECRKQTERITENIYYVMGSQGPSKHYGYLTDTKLIPKIEDLIADDTISEI